MSEKLFCLSGLGMTLQKPDGLKEPTENEDAYSLIELDSGQAKFKEIAIDFRNAGLKIVKIEELSNHLLWHKYKAEKKAIRKRKPQDPKFELNEKYLYHGTTADKNDICTEGLDSRLSKRSSRFGCGIYFSDNPLKCVNYAEKRENIHFVVLARVILGLSKVYPAGETDRLLVREPEKELPCKGWRFFDSVQGCPKDFKEYVIYRNDKALIECIVTYSKDDTSSSIPRPINSSSSHSATQVFSSVHSLPKANSGRVTQSARANDNADSDSSSEDEKAEELDTSEEEGKGRSPAGSSDEDEGAEATNGNSSDSSLEGQNDSWMPINNKPLSSVCAKPAVKVQRGEDILAEKKMEFIRKTGEMRQHVIESFLSTTGLDVDRAVRLFLDKERKKKEMEEKLQEKLQEKQKAESSEEEADVYEDSASGFVTPHSQPEKWRQMESEDRDAIVNILTDNFLTVIGLEDNAQNRALSRKFLFSCDCDLDSSIVAYYESI